MQEQCDSALDIEVYVRCDSDPYGIDKLFSHLKIGRETVYREQYYAVELDRRQSSGFRHDRR